jgi:hypothetical protein
MVKTMLLSKVKKADTGDTELDRVCQGLRMTMGWLAEAIERTALQEAGYADTRERRPPPPDESAQESQGRRPPGESSQESHGKKAVSS